MANTAKRGVMANIKLNGYDALFGASECADAEAHIIEAPLGELHGFKAIHSTYWMMKRWKKQ